MSSTPCAAPRRGAAFPRVLPSARAALLLAVLTAMACISAGPSALGADMAAGKRKAQICAACHGIDGVGKNPTVPNIAGESELYLTKQLEAFRSGERRHEQMSIVAKPLKDEDIADLAAWYAAIEFSVTLPQ